MAKLGRLWYRCTKCKCVTIVWGKYETRGWARWCSKCGGRLVHFEPVTTDKEAT